MSTIIFEEDTQSDPSTFAAIPSDAEISQPAPAATVAPVEAPVAASPELPEKFRGKSAFEIAESYASLESELGRQSQEIGTLRTLTDQLLEVRKTGPSEQNVGRQEEPELTVDDVLNDPRNAISRVAREEGAQTNSRVANIEATLEMQAFSSRHPSFKEDQNDPEFHAWVRESGLRQRAAQDTLDGDLNAADQLFGEWEQVKQAKASAETIPTADEIEAEESASAIAARGATSGATKPKPISRAELAEIKLNDEARYYSPKFQDWMIGMYRQKLVK